MSEDQGHLEGVDAAAMLSRLASDVAGLDERLGVHDETLEKIVDYITGPNVGGPWFWPRLSDAQRTKLLREVADFVLWLDDTYLTFVAKYRIPSCWWQHPDVRDQLIALMVSHRAVYTKKARAVSGALVDWHERALWPVMERLQTTASLGRCSNEGHAAFAGATRVRMEEDSELAKQIRGEASPAAEGLKVEWLEEPELEEESAS